MNKIRRQVHKILQLPWLCSKVGTERKLGVYYMVIYFLSHRRGHFKNLNAASSHFFPQPNFKRERRVAGAENSNLGMLFEL